MSKKIIILMLLGIVTVCAWGIDPVRFEVIERFGGGSGEWEFRHFGAVGGGSEPTSPSGFTAVGDRFYVEDYRNGRLVKFTLGREWNVVWGTSLKEILRNSESLLLALDSNSGFGLYNLDEEGLLFWGNFGSDVGRGPFHEWHVILVGDVILYQVQNSGYRTLYHSWYIPEDPSKGLVYRNPDQTIRFLKEDYEGTEEFIVDEEGYIFWNRRLVAPYGYSYARYHWNTNRPTTEWQATILFSRFVGWDRDGNTYWSDHRTLSVLNPRGESLAFLEASNVADTSRSQFTVTPDGTLYVVSYNWEQDEFELLKLDRFW